MASTRLFLFASVLCWICAPDVVRAGELFWYDASIANGRIRHCDLGSCTPSDFLTGVAAGIDNDIAIDPLEGMVYRQVNGAVAGIKKIQRRSLSGGPVQDIFSVDTTVTGMAIDPVARHVYMGTPATPTRIQRFSIDDRQHPTSFVLFNDVGCTSCQPQGLALDLANDRVYFSQTVPSRISYALLSSPTTLTDLVNPVPDVLYSGTVERDPTAGTLGELYIASSGTGEIRHCSIDAGCPSLALLDSGLIAPRGLALLPSLAVPALGRLGVACLAFLLALVVAWQRTCRTRRV